jgi:hypothetical protein
VIHGLPTDLEVGDVYEDGGDGLGAGAGGVPGPRCRRAGPKAGMTGCSWRLCFTSRSTTLPSGRCRSVSANETPCGSGSTDRTRRQRIRALLRPPRIPLGSAHLVQMFDSTIVRAHVSAAGAKRGQKDKALGRSRGELPSSLSSPASSWSNPSTQPNSRHCASYIRNQTNRFLT